MIGPAPRFPASRRRVLSGAALAALLALPGCATWGGYPDPVEAVRRLLHLSANRAFARLLAPGGFWDDQLARLDLPALFGRRGGVAERILASGAFRGRLQRSFNDMAGQAAYNAAPAVNDAIRVIGWRNAIDLVRGNPTAASDALRAEMGGRLIGIMVPAFGDALRVSSDPLLAEAITALSGVDAGGLADDLARQADGAIWGEIGRQEAAIRADPRETRDPVLISVFAPPRR